MPIKHDPHNDVSFGEIYCRPCGQSTYTKCMMVLDCPQQSLTCYYADQDSTYQSNSNEQILTEFKTDSIALVEAARKEKQQFCFAIHYFAKVTHFYAKSWKEMDDWIHLIKESSQIKVKRTDINPNRVSIAGSYRTHVIGGKVFHVPISDSSGLPEESSSAEISLDRKSSSSSQSSSSLDPMAYNHYRFTKTGYCVKMGRVRKNWKRRFLGMNDTQLMYFKHEQERKPLKIIEIASIRDVKVSDSDIPRENLIDVVTPNRTFHMQFDTNDDMYSWIEDLRKCVGLPVMTYL